MVPVPERGRDEGGDPGGATGGQRPATERRAVGEAGQHGVQERPQGARPGNTAGQGGACRQRGHAGPRANS
ncbi:hypothetical protein GCM10010214_15040 [Streptomyces abikoensis]|nr:hypothetical protein GCM10010214_15040 [Streptomyces abikoensis]